MNVPAALPAAAHRGRAGSRGPGTEGVSASFLGATGSSTAVEIATQCPKRRRYKNSKGSTSRCEAQEGVAASSTSSTDSLGQAQWWNDGPCQAAKLDLE